MSIIRLLPFLFFIILSSLVCAQKTDLEKRKLKGNVKRITANSYLATGEPGKLVKGARTAGYGETDGKIVFNTSGYILEQYNYLSGGEPYDSTFYSYDKNNRILTTVYGGDLGNYTGILYSTYLYNAKGEKIAVTTMLDNDYGKNQHDSTAFVRLKEDTNIIEETKYSLNGYPMNKYQTKYNAAGDLIYSSVFTCPNNPPVHDNDDPFYCYEYEKTVYLYDKNGNMVEELKDRSIASAEILGYLYDDKGNNIEIKKNGQTLLRFKYRYDEKGNVIKRYSYEGKKKRPHEIIVFEYDQYNNWIRRMCWLEGDSRIVEREIEYY